MTGKRYKDPLEGLNTVERIRWGVWQNTFLTRMNNPEHVATLYDEMNLADTLQNIKELSGVFPNNPELERFFLRAVSQVAGEALEVFEVTN